MKTSLLLVSCLALTLSAVADPTGTIIVSGPTDIGTVEGPIAPRAIVPYMELDITANGFEFFQAVNAVVERRSSFPGETTLYMSWGGKISRIVNTGSAQSMIIGPAYVGPNAGPSPTHVTIYGATVPTGPASGSDQMYIGYDLDGLTVSSSSTVHNTVRFEGTFPMISKTYIIDTNLVIGSMLVDRPHNLTKNGVTGMLTEIGGFSITVSNESSALSGFEMDFDNDTGDANHIAQICVTDESGQIVARPTGLMLEDKFGSLNMVFDQSVIVPVGRHEYRVKAVLSDDFKGATVRTSIPYVGGYLAKGQSTGSWFSIDAATSGYGPGVRIQANEPKQRSPFLRH